MIRKTLRFALLLGAITALNHLATPAFAQGGANCGPNCQPRYGTGQPDLFYNFYTPGNCAQATAAMYPCPIAVPPWVGYTYITYQPLMPHEFLYDHHRSYHRIYDDGKGLNATHISYR